MHLPPTILVMSQPLDTNGNAIRSFKIASKANSLGLIDIEITEPNLRADNLSFETWASSWVMATLIHRLSIYFPSSATTNSIPILELGAGTGLVGITAAHEWKRPVVLTDLTPNVPGMRANIDLNAALLKAADTHAMCGTLDWNSPEALILESDTIVSSARKAHVILAADTVYSEEHPELLEKVVVEWLARTKDARFIITYAMRVAYLDEIRGLWERLEAAGLVAVEEGQERASEGLFDDENLCEWSVWMWKELPISL